jgi:hypothetical protein
MGAYCKVSAVGERRMGVEAIPEGVVERILVKMHGMSKR